MSHENPAGGDPEGTASRLAERSERLLGRRVQGVWCAPGRVNLIGEHTDYNSGLVLPAAISLRAFVAAALRSDNKVTCTSLELPGTASARIGHLRPGSVIGWPAYALGVIWALREAGVDPPGVDLVVSSEVPIGAGLSSSAALDGAVALAVADLAGSGLDRMDLAFVCRRAENEMAGAPVGIMDHIAALLGQEGCALLVDCRSLQVEAIPLGLERCGLRLLVLDTGVTHANASGAYGERRRSCQEASALLGVESLRDATPVMVEALASPELRARARHVVTENARVEAAAALLREGRPAELGNLFAASHASLRLDFEVSCAELDVAVEAAIDAGALAARMTGAGFGGCVISIVRQEEQEEVVRYVTAAFAARGWGTPRSLDVVAVPGARRLM